MRADRPWLIFILIIAVLASPASGFGQRARQAKGAHPYADAGAISAPRLFAEGIVNTSADEYGPAFTPDGRTIYFAKRSADRKMEHIYFSRFDAAGRWGEQQLAPFSGKYFDKEPFISPDGSKLFFASTRPVDASAPGRADFNLWMVERAGATWGAARPLGAEVNSETYDNYPAVAANGNLYFSSTRAGGQGSNDLYRARFVQGRYAPAENLASLNTPQSDADPYIAPDESYIIISTTRMGTYGEGDLYISFNVGGAWTELRNLGAGVNSATYEYTPLVSPDGKYLFFSRGWGDIYLLDVSALPLLRREAADRAATTATNVAPRRQVAVTFDDLPFTGDGGKTTLSELREFTSKLLSTFASNKIPAIGFVNERKLEHEGEREGRVAVLKMWTDAGLELGNHTYGHASFYRTPPAAFRQQVIDGEPVTRTLLAARNMKLRYFRHPYLNTGPDLKTKEAFEQFLNARGYRVAPVTIDNAEWIFAQAYAQALQRGDRDTAARVADEYVPYMERMFEFYERMSIELFGREIAQTLLVHANALNADHFGRIAAMMKRRGYEFVSLDEALKDKAYEHPDTYTGAVGISWLQRWTITRGGKFKKEPALPDYMRKFDPAGSGSDFKTAQGK